MYRYENEILFEQRRQGDKAIADMAALCVEKDGI